jgi:hypothetical protein
MPSMDTLETMMRNDYVSYKKFMEWFVSCVVCRETFRKSSSKIFVSNYVTVSDETMTFLILKNNYNL